MSLDSLSASYFFGSRFISPESVSSTAGLVAFEWIIIVLINKPETPTGSNETLMTDESPGSIGLSGHFPCTQWQLPFASVMTSGMPPVFLNLKSWFAFVFPSIMPTSIFSFSNLISAKLFFGVSFLAELASPQPTLDNSTSEIKNWPMLFIFCN